MPKLNEGQATLFVEVTDKADGKLRKSSEKRDVSLCEVLDDLISQARKEFVSPETLNNNKKYRDYLFLKKGKRSKTVSLIISKENKEWLKNFSKKIDMKMAPLVEMIIQILL